jgi:BirA family transcriptional regulator, biotin operon repressor / biotin---[acetyl-CoA-carboxylase] ligase
MLSETLEDEQAQRDAVALIRRLAEGGEPLVDSALGPARLDRAREVMSRWGLSLERRSGVWRLVHGPRELLSVEGVREGLPRELGERLGLHVFPVLDSTSRWLMAQPADERACLGCLAEYQSCGRGRRGRDWVMPFGSGIALSLRWDVSAWAEVPPRVTLTLGLAIARTLHEAGVADIGLKWPNDLVVSGRKLGGMLVEQRRSRDYAWLVVGLGLNVRMPPSIPVDQPWTDLESLLPGPVPGRNRLAALLIEAIVNALRAFPAHDPEALREGWSRFDVLADETVRVQGPGGVIEGVARGIDASGRLRVVGETGDWLLDAGEVSVRRIRT